MRGAVRSPLVVALGALAIFLAGLEMRWPGFFLHDDNATWFAGAYAQDFRTLTETGGLAEVNFYQYGGEPFVEQGQTGVLYPLVYVAGALASLMPGDLRWTVDWLAAIHLALALSGFYAWLRRGGVDATLAALGGLAWALNPFVLLLGASWIMVTAAAAWLPWLFWALDGVVAPSCGTPSGCASFLDRFRGYRPAAGFNPRLRLWQAFGLHPSGPAAEREGKAAPQSTESGAQKIVRGPSTALGSAATDKPSLSPRSAQDDGFLKSGLRRGVVLGVIAGMFVLQGYVQWAAYAFLFAGMYAAYWIFVGSPRACGQQLPDAEREGERENELGSRSAESAAQKIVGGPSTALGQAATGKTSLSPRSAQDDGFLKSGLRRLARGRALWALGVAGLVALAIALPQVLPLSRGAAESKMRAEVLTPMFELFYRVDPADLVAAQFGFFHPHFLFGASTALFFCPALVLLPVAVMAFARGDAETRRRLFPLILLAVMALVFSGRGYFLLNVLPFMAKFRWPFKVFLFAEFFLIGALVWAVDWWGSRRTPREDDPSVAQEKIVKGPSTALVSAATGKPSLSPRSAQDDGILKSGLRRLGHGLPFIVLAVVLLLEIGVALEGHEGNFLSAEVLPASRADLPAGMDPAMGRTIAMGVAWPVADAYRFFTHAYGTYYEVPSIGGYNPLVSRGALAFALGIDIPNFWDQPISPEMRAGLEARAVRYWIVEGHSPQAGEIAKLEGMKLLVAAGEASSLAPSGLGSHVMRNTQGFALGSPISPPWGSGTEAPSTGNFQADRLIFEDAHAMPIAFDEASPQTALPVRYAGNSMLIQLGGARGTIAVSVGPTDGWWYRVDGAEWKQSGYGDFRLRIPVAAGGRELEVRYFDPELRKGFRMSLLIIGLLIICASLWPRLRRKTR